MSFGYQVLGFGSGGAAPLFIVATGGTESTDGNYKVHKFTGPGTLCVSAIGNPGGSDTVDYLVVAGGGGGGTQSGGGGGAGGMRLACTCSPSPLKATALPVSVQGYPITVGGGGAGGVGPTPNPNPNRGCNGANSTFSSITSAGGGGGGANSPPARTGKVAVVEKVDQEQVVVEQVILLLRPPLKEMMVELAETTVAVQVQTLRLQEVVVVLLPQVEVVAYLVHLPYKEDAD